MTPAPEVGDPGWIIPLGDGRYAFIPAEVPEVGDLVYTMPRQYGGYGAVPQFGIAVGDPVFVRPDPLGSPSFDAIELGGRPSEGGYHEPTILYDTGNLQTTPFCCDPWIQFIDIDEDAGYRVLVVNTEDGTVRTLLTGGVELATDRKYIGTGDYAVTWTASAVTLWDLSAGTSGTIYTTGTGHTVTFAAVGAGQVVFQDRTSTSTAVFYTYDIASEATTAAVSLSRATGAHALAVSEGYILSVAGAGINIATIYSRADGSVVYYTSASANNTIACIGDHYAQYTLKSLYDIDGGTVITLPMIGPGEDQQATWYDFNGDRGLAYYLNGTDPETVTFATISIPDLVVTDVEDLTGIPSAAFVNSCDIDGTLIAYVTLNEPIKWMRLAS